MSQHCRGGTRYRQDPRDRKLHSGHAGAVFLVALALITSVWPFFIWHGQAGTERVWDHSSTVACGIWWGVLTVTWAVFAVAQKRRA